MAAFAGDSLLDKISCRSFESRSPVTTRVRPEIATALKRASLNRQLHGQEPFHVQEIMEEALGEWLGSRGHLT